MGAPAWLADALAAVVLVIAAYDVGRLAMAAATGRRSERDVDAFHVAMGVSMAAMLTGNLTSFSSDAWAVLFACTTVWFALRLPWAMAVRTTGPPLLGHRLSHVVTSGAMVYMLLAVRAGSGGGGLTRRMAGMDVGSTKLPFLAVLLAVLLFGGAVVHADRRVLRRGRRLLAGTGPDPRDRTDLDVSLMQAGTTSATSLVETRQSPTRADAPAPFLAPRLAATCQVVMGLVMVYMLITMV